MAEDPARKERLRKLREAAEAAGQGKEHAAADGAADMAKPVLKFRNYQVHDAKHIQHEQVIKADHGLHGAVQHNQAALMEIPTQVAPAQVPQLEEPKIEKMPEQAPQEVGPLF
jgi:hypothetical protein